MYKVVSAFVFAVILICAGVVAAHAHCGKTHEGEGKILVAQLSHEDLAFELKAAETAPDVEALERAIEAQEEAEAQHRLDQLVKDLMLQKCGNMEPENFRVENGKFNSIPPANIQLK